MSATNDTGVAAHPALADLNRIPPPLKDITFPTPFINGDYGDGLTPYTLIEQRLMMGLGAIKEKPQWWRKASDEAIAARWRAELAAAFVAYLKKPTNGEFTFVGVDAEDANDETSGRAAIAGTWADAVLKEISEAAALVVEEAGATYVPGPVDGTWLSDDAVNATLKARLAELIKPLENPVDRFTGQPAPRDYHPGSDEQVVDLVHPSLYPLVFGRSLVAPVGSEETIFSWKKLMGKGATQESIFAKTPTPQHAWMKQPEFHSTRFQWLPSEIDLRRKEGSPLTARFRSYINNLHPEEHTELYRTLEEVFATAFAPLYTKVLTELAVAKEKPRRQPVAMDEETIYGEFEPNEDEDEDEQYDNWYENRVPRVDTVLEQTKSPPVPPTINLDNTRLQVIVKLASIELTPEKPSYGGGSWHVEGMVNESIVASGIYYMASENVRGEGEVAPEGEAAPTRLAFRTSVCEPPYEQNDDKGVKAVYGLVNEDALIQPLGSVATTEGRCLAWPNTLQHQVQPFALADPTKPGHRKILVFFLVDPTKRIISTADVPPQQEEWALKELLVSSSEGKSSSAAVLANRDVLGEVLKFSWHFSHADALAVREELMAERKVFVDETMKEAYERDFSLCEH